jgi:hypothetical protein
MSAVDASDELIEDEPCSPPEWSYVTEDRRQLSSTGRKIAQSRRFAAPITARQRGSNTLFDRLRQREGSRLADVADNQIAASAARPPGKRQVAAPLGSGWRVRGAVG